MLAREISRRLSSLLLVGIFCVGIMASAVPCVAVDTDQECSVYLIPAEGGTPKEIFRSRDRLFGSPDWSPDGKYIALDTWKTENPKEKLWDAKIAILPVEGGELEIIGEGAMPSWSPDGNQLVCHTYTPNQIVLMQPNGSNRVAILNQWGSPRWSPSGESIITARSSGGIARYDFATGKQTVEVAKRTSIWQGLSISPDGKKYCFASRDRPGFAITCFDDYAEAWITEWFPGYEECMHSSWSPDSRRVAFHAKAKTGENITLYILDLDKSGKQQIQPLSGIPTGSRASSPDWSPDGKLLVFTGKIVE